MRFSLDGLLAHSAPRPTESLPIFVEQKLSSGPMCKDRKDKYNDKKKEKGKDKDRQKQA